VTAPLPLPAPGALLLQPRRDAIAAFLAVGWRAWATPFDLDAERRRALNLDLAEPDVSMGDGNDPKAVAHVETDREGLVTLVEITTAVPFDPASVARALLGTPGDPVVHGGASAREWIWGPESGAQVGGEPVRLWIAAEQAYGDRLWINLSVVRRPSLDGEDED
jgi:hypothetical protein